MKTLTIKIPDSMNEKLRRRAAEQEERLSETVRRALTRELDGNVDFSGLAAPFKGMFKGPKDLSTREGYDGPDAR